MYVVFVLLTVNALWDFLLEGPILFYELVQP